MRLIITGASGFLGKNILLNASKDWEIVAVYNNTNLTQFLKDNQLDNVRAEMCDLTNYQDLDNLAKRVGSKFDVCLYLAANTLIPMSIENPILDLKVNTISVLNFLEHFRGDKFVYLSSGAVYDGLSGKVSPENIVSPLIPYAISKLASEYYIKFHIMKKKTFSRYVILRFFGAYGPYEPERKIYTKLANRFCIERNGSFNVYGNGENLINAMYVDDAVRGILKVIEGNASNLTLDFCSDNHMTIDDLVKESAEIFGISAPKIIHEGDTAEYIQFYVSGKAMRDAFDFKSAVTLNEGLVKLAEWLHCEQDKKRSLK